MQREKEKECGSHVGDYKCLRLVRGLRDLTRVVDVACGVYHTLALTADANVYSWGWGNDGRLGHGEEYYVLSPRKIEALAGAYQAAVSLLQSLPETTRARHTD